MLADLRFALRQLRKSPGFTAVAVLTLALGIGANTAIFSVINGALLRPLSYPEPEQLIEIWSTEPGGPFDVVPGPTFQFWHEHTTLLDGVAVFRNIGWNLLERGSAERIRGLEVSADYLRVFRIEPPEGRGFAPDEDQPGHPPVVMLTWEWWQNHFGGDTAIIGRTLNLRGTLHTVIGILPPRSLVKDDVDFLVPVVIDAEPWRQSIENPWAHIIARLKPGVSLEQVDAELATMTAQHYAAHPPRDNGYGATAIPLHDQLTANTRPALVILVCAAGVLLLIVCANLANLLLARARMRTKEIAVRVALGASGGRIVRQVLTESIVLALAGGILGVAIAAIGVRLLGRVTAGLLPLALQPAMSLSVLGYSLVIAGGTGVLFGVIPAWRARRVNMVRDLNDGGRGSSSGSRLAAQSLLIISEIALTVTLLISAGLLLRSFARVLAVNPGFTPAQSLVGEVSLTRSTLTKPEQVIRFEEETLRRLEALPGVDSAGMITTVPLTGEFWGGSFGLTEKPDVNDEVDAGVDYVSGHAFAALGMPLLKGRALTEADNRPDAPLVCVLSDRLVRRLMGDEEPIGRHIRFEDKIWEIVGVVSSVRARRLEYGGQRRFYGPQIYNPWTASLVIRTSLPPESLVDGVRRTFAGVDPTQSITNLRPLDEVVNASLRERRLTLVLVTIFAAAALGLAGLGIYGVMAYTVAQRDRELSIRTALGAQRHDVMRLVLVDGFRLGLIGLVLGLGGALATSRLVASRLYQVGARDPGVFVAVTVALGLVVFASVLIPALRAARASPIDALRAE